MGKSGTLSGLNITAPNRMSNMVHLYETQEQTKFMVTKVRNRLQGKRN